MISHESQTRVTWYTAWVAEKNITVDIYFDDPVFCCYRCCHCGVPQLNTLGGILTGITQLYNDKFPSVGGGVCV